MSEVLTRRPRIAADPFAAAAVLLALLGSLLAWTTFRGFPGQLAAHFFVGGVRVYTLALAVGLALAFVDVPGRRKAGLAISWGIVAVAATTMLFVLERKGGGAAFFTGLLLVVALLAVASTRLSWAHRYALFVAGGAGVLMLAVLALSEDARVLGALNAGGWFAFAGGVVGVYAFDRLPPDRPVRAWRGLPGWVELLGVAAALALLLAAVVYGLGIDDADEFESRFIAYLAALVAVGLALNALGVFAWLSAVYQRHRSIVLVAVLLTAAAFPFTQGGNAYWIRVAASVGVFAGAAIGLNIVVGLAGLLDLGYVAFFGVGAYTASLLSGATQTSKYSAELPFFFVIFIAAAVAAIFGILIGAPTLRLRGDYLAIVTLGFGEIFRICANNMDWLTRGPNGIAGIPHLEIAGFDFGNDHELFGVELPYFANYFLFELLLIGVIALVFNRLNSSRIGRAWVAIREDETAAEAMGVNTVAMKLLAFAIGAFLAGAAGAVNAHLLSQVSPDSYEFLQSVFLLAAVVLGGMGTVPGAILGSVVLLVLPEKLRFLEEKRLLVFGVMLVLMMRFRPEGILASSRRAREFHEGDREGDAMGAPPGSPVQGKAVMP